MKKIFVCLVIVIVGVVLLGTPILWGLGHAFNWLGSMFNRLAKILDLFGWTGIKRS